MSKKESLRALFFFGDFCTFGSNRKEIFDKTIILLLENFIEKRKGPL
jgi:hypothetical protein